MWNLLQDVVQALPDSGDAPPKGLRIALQAILGTASQMASDAEIEKHIADVRREIAPLVEPLHRPASPDPWRDVPIGASAPDGLRAALQELLENWERVRLHAVSVNTPDYALGYEEAIRDLRAALGSAPERDTK